MIDYGSVLAFLNDESETVALGERLGSALDAGVIVFLEGELGAGKTTLTRGVLRAHGYTGAVKSPTYTLCEPYELDAGHQFCHFDLYRLSSPEELELLGLRDYISCGAMVFIEWPCRGVGWLPSADLTVTLAEKRGGREVALTAGSEAGATILMHLSAANA